MTSNSKKSGNIAIAYTNIDGLSKTEFYSSNKINLLTETLAKRVPDISLKPTNTSEIFTYTTELTADGRKVARNVDSEYKILNDIANRLGDNPNVEGTVRLFTELAPCPSCMNVIKQFMERYSKVKFILIHNLGARLIN